MLHLPCYKRALALASLTLLASNLTHASFTVMGDVTPSADSSEWTSASLILTTDVFIGETGDGSLSISDGSVLENTGAFIGFESGSNGEVAVTGTGSSWTNSQSLYVGYNGDGTLTIADFGTVNVHDWTFVQDSSGTGRIMFDGGSLSTGGLYADASYLSGAGTITTHGLVGDGYETAVFDGSNADSISLVDGENTLTINVLADGNEYDMGIDMRVINGAQVSSNYGFAGYNTGDSTSIEVIGEDSSWTNAYHLYIGQRGHATLMIADGGSVSNNTGYIAYYAGSSGDVTVTGGNSTWASTGSLYVGRYGNGTLMISDGAEVSNAGGLIAYGSDSISGAIVTGAGSTWTNSNNVCVGYDGDGTLTISNGGSVSSAAGVIGYRAGSTGNAFVTGVGSKWTCSSSLYVGQYGDGTLSIGDYGAVDVAKTTYVGYTSGTGHITFDHGTLTTGGLEADASELSGTGSIITHGLLGSGYGTLVFDGTNTTSLSLVDGEDIVDLTLTADGTFSNLGVSMHILNDAQIFSRNGYLGYTRYDSTSVEVSGQNSSWTNYDSLYVGKAGEGTLSISDGASVSNVTGYIADSANSVGEVTVTGNDSTWMNSGSLYVGNYGEGKLTIFNGASVSNTIGYIGAENGGVGEVTVTGENSSWTNTSTLHVGNNGEGKLMISNGASVSNTIGYVDGEVTVTGENSSWTSTNTLYLGNDRESQLTVSDGATVSGVDVYLGNASSETVQATVTGAGSSWINSGALYMRNVEYSSFTIANGGSFSNTHAHIGASNRSITEITVTGAGSSWMSTGFFYLGSGGLSRLTVSDGGRFSTTDAYISLSSYDFAEITVTGIGSKWIDFGNLTLGYSGRASLTVSNHAQVSSAAGGSVNEKSTVHLAVSSMNERLLSIGDSTHTTAGLENNGTILMYAVGKLRAETYTPITVGSQGSYSGAGTYCGFGGLWDTSLHQFVVSELISASSGTYTTDSLAGMRLSYGSDNFIVAFAEKTIGTNISVAEIENTGLEYAVAAYTITSTDTDVDDALLNFCVSEYLEEDGYVLMYRASSADEWSEYDYTIVSSFYSVQDGYLSLITSVDADTGIGGFGDYALIATMVPEPEQFAAILGLLALFVAYRRHLRA